MNVFQNQIDFVSQMEDQLFLSLQRAIESFGFVIKDFIVNKQLFQKGIDGNSKRLAGYSRITIKIKRSKGQPTDRTTLHDSERFVGSIEIKAFSDRFVVSSNVPYVGKLVKQYGKDIFKLTDENLAEFLTKFYLPILKQYVDDKFTR